MKVYKSELENWSKFRALQKTTPLTPEQLKQIDQRSKFLLKQTFAHPYRHNIVGICLVLSLLLIDILSFTIPGILGLIIMTTVHGFILYSLTIYTLHEGAAHKRIILGSPILAFLVNNVSRLCFADPIHYQRCHSSHHQHLGTKDDKAFTHMIVPSRILKSFLPGAAFLKFNDYKIHSSDAWTISKIMTLLIGLNYSLILFLMAKNHQHSGVLVFIILIAAPWISFSLDRLRESSEHLLLKSDDLPEAREIGNNFWGYLIGGGPWGQPCHLSHHISPSLPWYQQLRLSREIKQILSMEQRKYFFIEDGFFKYPKKFIQLMKSNSQLFKQK
jgi:fatty acid desaturase